MGIKWFYIRCMWIRDLKQMGCEKLLRNDSKLSGMLFHVGVMLHWESTKGWVWNSFCRSNKEHRWKRRTWSWKGICRYKEKRK